MKIGLFFGSFNPIYRTQGYWFLFRGVFRLRKDLIYSFSSKSIRKQKRTLLDQHHELQIIRADLEDNLKTGCFRYRI